MSKRVILALYKSKLSQCVILGYKLGSKPMLLTNQNQMNHGQVKFGKYMFDKVKREYKNNKNITNKKQIEEYIYNGFSLLRQINRNVYEQQQQEQSKLSQTYMNTNNKLYKIDIDNDKSIIIKIIKKVK